MLLEIGDRSVTLLDGDIVRKRLSSEEFTGISDPYEIPDNPELILNSENKKVEECASLIMLKLKRMGLVFG